MARNAELAARETLTDLPTELAMVKEAKHPLALASASNPTAGAASAQPLFSNPPTRTFDTPAAASGSSSEIEIAASNNGKTVIVFSNGGLSVSNDGGTTFNPGPAIPPRPGTNSDGDPSITASASGAFYISRLDLFPANGQTKSVEIFASVDNGGSFAFRNAAFTCPNTNSGTCPDQPHIAARRVNASIPDEVYAMVVILGLRRLFRLGQEISQNQQLAPTAMCTSRSGAGTMKC
jgi:hypothetical protein